MPFLYAVTWHPSFQFEIRIPHLHHSPGYGGGDCCSCTCQTADNEWDDGYSCTEFACIDPNATCVEDDDATAAMVENCGNVFLHGNSYCDQENNNEGCSTCITLPRIQLVHGLVSRMKPPLVSSMFSRGYFGFDPENLHACMILWANFSRFFFSF